MREYIKRAQYLNHCDPYTGTVSVFSGKIGQLQFSFDNLYNYYTAYNLFLNQKASNLD